MARKTYYLDKDGIRIDGAPSQSQARKDWEVARNDFAKTAAECGQWIFQHRGHVLIVSPLPLYTWSYTIIRPEQDRGVIHATCTYSAKSQIDAIVQALGALVQSLWSPACDDAVLFDDMVKAARIFPAEAASQRSEFIYIASRWRESAAA